VVTAKIFTDNVEQEAIAQIITLLNQEFARDSMIHIMPDTHAGAGCTIGTTMTIHGKAVPYMVGVDIGCGMETVLLRDTHVELQKLDKIIHERIPAGFNVRSEAHEMTASASIHKLRCAKYVNLDRAYSSIGTLGGGNHFIERDKGEVDKLYLAVHSGSRYLDPVQRGDEGDLLLHRGQNHHRRGTFCLQADGGDYGECAGYGDDRQDYQAGL
jgi:RNA-splicing ligase RtcB